MSTISASADSATKAENDDASSSHSENHDSVIHMIISKFFRLQHANQNRLLELQHQIDVGRLQADEVANVKFDLEILASEKQWLDQEIDSLNTQVGSLNGRLQDQERASADAMEAQRVELEENYQRSA